MRVTQQPLLRRFWYPVIPMDRLTQGPQRFVLLDQPLVLWLDTQGHPAAAEDRCCHRSAQLSLGQVIDGTIRCPYHGWQFDRQGTCVKVPQLTEALIPRTYQIQSFHCEAHYGYAWVCLSPEPLSKIPRIPEAADPQFRLIHEFYEPWQVAGLRVMENEFDSAHPTFVHAHTFGSADHPTPESIQTQETDYGLRSEILLGVSNPELQQQNLKIQQPQTQRRMVLDWFLPFTAAIRIHYPNGLTHIIVNTPTPISDDCSQIVQFCLRNDTEAETPAQDVIQFDRAVTLEDKRILETTDPDVPLDLTQEQHMLTDQPGILMRRKLGAMLKAQGETEQRGDSF